MVVYESLELDFFTAVTGIRIPLGTPNSMAFKTRTCAFCASSGHSMGREREFCTFPATNVLADRAKNSAVRCELLNRSHRQRLNINWPNLF